MHFFRYSLQKKVAFVLFILTLSTAVLNFLGAVINAGYSPFKAVVDITVFPTVLASVLLLLTGSRDNDVLKYIQVGIIFLAGFATILVTLPGTLTGTLILLFGLSLTYQYGYFAERYRIKLFVLSGFYLIITLLNILLIHQLKPPNGIPSILFTVATIYLFWAVFQKEIEKYLISTNQLSRKLSRAETEKLRLDELSRDQAEMILEKNKILEQHLVEKNRIESELRHTLEIKEVLLQEVHHRVKNNLAVIGSLLNLQLSDSDLAEKKDFIQSNAARIDAMAAVHEAVYPNDSFQQVLLSDYLSDITANLVQVYAIDDNIDISMHCDHIELSVSAAVPLGIVLNDCVSSSILNGFSDSRARKQIRIHVSADEEIEVLISDNGDRYSPGNSEMHGDKVFDERLIRLLVEGQLEGTIISAHDDGNRWLLRFSRSLFQSDER